MNNLTNKNEAVDADALLISWVRNHPYLYDHQLRDFKDKIKRQNAWLEIGNILGITADECQTRWTRLRERYAREKKLIQETAANGGPKRRLFEFYTELQFLDPFVKRRRPRSSVYLKSSSLPAKCFDLQKNFVSCGEKEDNLPLVWELKQDKNEINTTSELVQETDAHVNIDPLLREPTFLESDTSTSFASGSDYRRKSSLEDRTEPKGNSDADVIGNAVCKITSIIEQKFSSSASSSLPLKPEIEEDVSFCQLILSLLRKMPENESQEKKKKILRIMYDM